MSAAARVLVVGGGIGGLSATIALRNRGIEVDVVESNPNWDVYGVGIIQPGNAIRALDQLGVADRAIAVGFAMDGDRFHTADGTLMADNEHPRVLGPDYPRRSPPATLSRRRCSASWRDAMSGSRRSSTSPCRSAAGRWTSSTTPTSSASPSRA